MPGVAWGLAGFGGNGSRLLWLWAVDDLSGCCECLVGVVGWCDGSPGDMAVGADQHGATGFEPVGVACWYLDCVVGLPLLRRSCHEQHEVGSEGVEDRPGVAVDVD